MQDNVKSPFDKEPAEGSRETIDRQLARQSTNARSDAPEDSSDRDGAAELLGDGALRIWGELSRDTQEALFEAAIGDYPERRQARARMLHALHPRTEHSQES